MQGQGTIAEYTSQDNEKVKVVAGRVRGYYGEHSTRVYVGKELMAEFSDSDIQMDAIPFVKHALDDLASGCATADEVISTLNALGSSIAEQDTIEDDLNREPYPRETPRDQYDQFKWLRGLQLAAMTANHRHGRVRH